MKRLLIVLLLLIIYNIAFYATNHLFKLEIPITVQVVSSIVTIGVLFLKLKAGNRVM
ncbi:hypothetical protein [Pedobacter agri]|uniref:hypothetical protein n=1 Tax=Pedobacter agri TaxID=454586 RepID=UPI00292D8E77|nr:hypothetical protein [Pedobacter agri]